jgi:putative oxidoreductase
MAMFDKLGNYRNTGLLLMRVGLGIMMMIHGYPKLMGGPDGWTKLGGAMGNVGIHFAPMFWGFMAAATEAVGGLLIVLGLFTRPVCILMIINLAVAALHHFSKGDGIDGAAHAIETGIAFLGLLFLGPGRYSIDKK